MRMPRFRRLAAGLVTGALSIGLMSTAAPADGVPSAAGGPAHHDRVHYFGSLKTDPARASEEAPTMKLAMVEMNWRTAQQGPGGVDDDDPETWNAAYFAETRDKIDAFRASGRQVVLGLGMHYEPAWVLELSHMRDQNGVENTTNANVAFSQSVRTALNDYIEHTAEEIDFGDLWGFRINVASNAGEIQYPTDDFWAYSSGAQNGADKPVRLQPNPYPGWRAGTGDTSLSVRQVERWARWYQGALANSMDEQMDTISAAGFRGHYFLIAAGGGVRPQRWKALVDDKLATVANIGVGRGIAWDKFYAALKPRRHVVAYSSSTAENTNYNACERGDRRVPLDADEISSWSAARWMARVAHQYGHEVAGENPGYHHANPAYADTSADGMMARAFELVETCNFLAFFWAHDAQLWDPDLPGTSYARYAALIDEINHGQNPAPRLPGGRR